MKPNNWFAFVLLMICIALLIWRSIEISIVTQWLDKNTAEFDIQNAADAVAMMNAYFYPLLLLLIIMKEIMKQI